MKEMIVDFFDSFKERLKSKITGTYILLFLVHNWEPISIFFFSKKEIEEVLVIIKKYDNVSVFTIPLLFSILFVILIPFLNYFIEMVTKKIVRVRRELFYKEKAGILNEKITIADLERQIAEKRAGTREIEDLKSKIDELSLKNESHLEELKLIKNNYEKERNAIGSSIFEKDGLIEELKDQNKILNDDLLSYRKLFPVLTLEGRDAKVKIELFLKSYLSENEILRLKGFAKGESQFPDMQFRAEVNTLLLKAQLFEYNEQAGLYRMTEMGRLFTESKL